MENRKIIYTLEKKIKYYLDLAIDPLQDNKDRLRYSYIAKGLQIALVVVKNEL